MQLVALFVTFAQSSRSYWLELMVDRTLADVLVVYVLVVSGCLFVACRHVCCTASA